MKKVFIIIYLLFSLNCYSQEIQEFQHCIDNLQSEEYLLRLFAVECVTDLKLQETVEILIGLIDIQPPYLQLQFLNALYVLEYSDIQTMAHELISRADEFDQDPEHPYDPLDAKVFATAILVYTGDFSTIEYAFEQLNGNQITNENITAFYLLPYVMSDVPSYRDEAKNILLNELHNDNVDIRYYAIGYLAEEFGEEMNDELVYKFINDDDFATRVMSLKHLCHNNYSNLNSLLKERLENEEEWALRTDIVDTLLQKFGKPSDLKTVVDYQPNEPDGTARSLMNFSIKEFIPSQPGDNVNIKQMIDYFLSYIKELSHFEWILPNAQFDFYNHAREVLYNFDGEQYALALELLLEIIVHAEDALANEEITVEGYKFLYYHGNYIKDRIEDEFGD